MTPCHLPLSTRVVGLAIASLLVAASTVSGADRDGAIEAVAARIDSHIRSVWKQEGVKPAPPVDDATFLRRVSLDLAGKVPPLTVVRDFLDDPDPDKRRQLVRRLLRTDDYARHTAVLWGRQLFPPPPNTPPLFSPGVAWLRQQIKASVGHDRIARALLAPTRPGGQGNTAAEQFQGANQGKAESVAAAASRLFLGIKLECAQCHDHPFDRWKREDFWRFAAFFSAIPDPQGQRPLPKEPGREIAIPNSDRVVRARFLDGAQPQFPEGADGREVLADWIVRRDNPYFTRAVANQVWARYFGMGIVDPPDDLRLENPPSHPALLDELARAFADAGFDERFLVEAILTSKTYQLSSTRTDPSQEDQRRFARAAVRGLSGEQVYDSLAVVTGNAPRPGSREPSPNGSPSRQQFLARFTTPDRPTEGQTPVLQALHFMNGPVVAEASRPERNRWLRILTESAVEHPERCVEEIYLTVLIRPPKEAERARFVQYIREGGPHKDAKRAVADVFWVLLNSTEFVLNH
jgi:hypothetical protein